MGCAGNSHCRAFSRDSELIESLAACVCNPDIKIPSVLVECECLQISSVEHDFVRSFGKHAYIARLEAEYSVSVVALAPPISAGSILIDGCADCTVCNAPAIISQRLVLDKSVVGFHLAAQVQCHLAYSSVTIRVNQIVAVNKAKERVVESSLPYIGDKYVGLRAIDTHHPYLSVSVHTVAVINICILLSCIEYVNPALIIAFGIGIFSIDKIERHSSTAHAHIERQVLCTFRKNSVRDDFISHYVSVESGIVQCLVLFVGTHLHIYV